MTRDRGGLGRRCIADVRVGPFVLGHGLAGLLAVCGVACSPRDRVVAVEADASVGGPGHPFGPPVLVSGLLDPTDLVQDPSLSADELEIYFAALKGGTYDIWTSTRPSPSGAWAPATVVAELSTANTDLEPSLTGDDLTIYLASDRAGGSSAFGLWISERPSRSAPWGIPRPLDFGIAITDRGPTVDAGDLNLVFTSDRGSGDLDLYRTSRASTAVDWGPAVTLGEINSSVFDWDPALYDRARGLVFGSRRNGDQMTSDLFETSRASDAAPFATPEVRTELNSPRSEGDPWLSNDGRHIMFSSDRSGTVRLYEAWR